MEQSRSTYNVADEAESTSTSMATEAAQKYDYVRFTFTDINGISRCKLVKRNFLKTYFENGMAIYEATIGVCFRGEIFTEKLIDDRPFYHGNVMVSPQIGTLHSVPSGSTDTVKLGEVLCEIRYLHDGSYQQACPRYVARRQLEKLKQIGYDVYSGFELEWLMLDEKTNEPVFKSSGEVFNGPAMTSYSHILFEIDQCLEGMGVLMETLQSEYAPGQIEFSGTPRLGMTTADHLVLTRDCIREVTQKYGKKSVFMTKSFRDLIAANGLHWSLSLKDDKGNNMFYDAADPNKMSSLFYHWLAGLVKHSRAITALCCPTVNCYRRMHHPHAWTPCYATWGLDDRVASYRIKNHGPQGTYVESRLASGSANPYLVMAAIVAAGTDGIVNQLECPDKASYIGYEPVGNPERFPYTLAEALDELNKDTTITEALGAEFIKWFNVIKRFEIDELNNSDVRNDADNEDNFEKERNMYFKYL